MLVSRALAGLVHVVLRLGLLILPLRARWVQELEVPSIPLLPSEAPGESLSVPALGVVEVPNPWVLGKDLCRLARRPLAIERHDVHPDDQEIHLGFGTRF